MAKTTVTDERLARTLGVYAGMVGRVVADPARWLADDSSDSGDGDAPTGLRGRAVDAVSRRAFGSVTPASAEWPSVPVADRVAWWVRRIGAVAGLAAAAPRFAGALADRVPLQAGLGASASGIAVCAVARENGIAAAADWVPLLAKVLFDRDLARDPAVVPDPGTSEQKLAEADDESPEEKSGGGGSSVLRGAKTLWRLARTFRDIQDLLDHRPRGGFLARAVAKVPVVGVAGGWLDERGAIRRSAEETGRLVAGGTTR